MLTIHGDQFKFPAAVAVKDRGLKSFPQQFELGGADAFSNGNDGAELDAQSAVFANIPGKILEHACIAGQNLGGELVQLAQAIRQRLRSQPVTVEHFAALHPIVEGGFALLEWRRIVHRHSPQVKHLHAIGGTGPAIAARGDGIAPFITFPGHEKLKRCSG